MSKITKVVSVSREDNFVGYKILPIDSFETGTDERFFTHGFLLDSFRKIMGKTLTIIDASIQDKQQNKAMKDLIRNVFSDEIGFASEMGYDQKLIDELVMESCEEMSDEEIEKSAMTIEEVLGVE